MVELSGQINMTSRAEIERRKLYKQLKSFPDASPGKAQVLIDQPSISSKDFKANRNSTCMLTNIFLPLWNGTFLSYLQTHLMLDMEEVVRYYMKRCDAELIEVDLGRGNEEKSLFEFCEDPKTCFIKVRPPEMPADLKERRHLLYQSNRMLDKFGRNTSWRPYSTIYTNSDCADTSETPLRKYVDFEYIYEILHKANELHQRSTLVRGMIKNIAAIVTIMAPVCVIDFTHVADILRRRRFGWGGFVPLRFK